MQIEKDYVKDLELEVSGYKQRILDLEAQLGSITARTDRKEIPAASGISSESKNIVEYAFYPTAIIDKDNNILHVNKQFERSFGYNQNALRQMSFEILIPGITIDGRKKFKLNFRPEKNNRLLGKQSELMAIHKDGSQFPVELGFSYFDTKEGYQIHATVIDISERKKIEKSLLQYIERLDLSLRG